MAGKDAGQVGTVTKVIRDVRFPRVLVEGLNLVRWGQHACGQGCRPCSGAACLPSPCCASHKLLSACGSLRAAAHMRCWASPLAGARAQAGKVPSGTVLHAPHRSHQPTSAARLQNKRFLKRTKDNPGGIVSVESPLHYSNVKLVDPQTGQPVRVTWRFLEDGTKVRAAAGQQWCNATGAGL